MTDADVKRLLEAVEMLKDTVGPGVRIELPQDVIDDLKLWFDAVDEYVATYKDDLRGIEIPFVEREI